MFCKIFLTYRTINLDFPLSYIQGQVSVFFFKRLHFSFLWNYKYLVAEINTAKYFTIRYTSFAKVNQYDFRNIKKYIQINKE